MSINDSVNAYDNFDKGANLSSNRILREQVYFQIAEISFNKNDFEKALDSYQKVLSNTISLKRIQDSNLKIIKIFRLRGELEKSANKIQELIVDEDFSSIKSDLDLELTKIELSKGKIDFAIENFDRIGKDYPNTKTAVESYYLLSEIYLKPPKIDFEKSKFFMNESMKQNTNSPFKVLINKKRDDVDKLIELDSNLKLLNSNEKAENLFLSGEILAFNLASYRESIFYFNEIIDNHKSSDFYLQSLFAIYIINKKIGDQKLNKFKDIILMEYPNSDFAKYIINTEDRNIEHLPSKTLLMAEDLKDKDISKSIELYKKVLDFDKSTESSKIAAYFLGMYYDYEISQLDSAKFYYDFITSQYPNSSQAQAAKKRLEVINAK